MGKGMIIRIYRQPGSSAGQLGVDIYTFSGSLSAPILWSNADVVTFLAGKLHDQGVYGAGLDGGIRVESDGVWGRLVTLTVQAGIGQTPSESAAVVNQAFNNIAALYPDQIWNVGVFSLIAGGQITVPPYTPPVNYVGGTGGSTGSGSGSSGNYTGGSRAVVIRITCTPGIGGTLFSSPESAITTALRAAGWDLTQVAVQSGGWIGGTQIVIDVYANVENQFTDADINSHIRTDLAGTATVTNVQIVRFPGVGYVTDPNNPAAAGSDAWSKFWAGFGFATAPSIGMGILGVGLVAVLLTRD